MNKKAVYRAITLMPLSLALITLAGPASAAEPVLGDAVSIQPAPAPDGVHSYLESSTSGGERRVVSSERMDYTRLQGAGLLLSETMLGTMDERLGIDADARSTTKRVWLRAGGAFEGGGRQQQVGQYCSETSRYRVATLALGTDFYRTPTQRAGAFVGMGSSTFGSDRTIASDKLRKPGLSAASLGLYYNHNSLSGWYLDGAVQMARLRGEFGQRIQDNTSSALSSSGGKSVGTATNSGTAFAVQAEFGYRYALSSTTTLTPKLRLDYHQVRLGKISGNARETEVAFNGLKKTGVYYGLRLAKDWETARGRLQVWAESGVSHVMGAQAKSVLTMPVFGNQLAHERSLRATQIGLRLGIEGNVTRTQNLRLEGRVAQAVGRKNGMGTAIIASWNMGF